jgi:serine/threonine protein kinase
MSESPPAETWPALETMTPADRPIVPGYEILEELGRGGMGVVYKARQVSLKRFVALKVIRDGALAGAQERRRFRIEAEAAARMQHPNIVQIFDIGDHQGRAYFAMELLEGGSLDKHIAGRPQSARQAAKLVRSLALAVQHAHMQQVVHRDLKPANVLLQIESKDEPKPSLLTLETAIPKITDFGLAKRLDSESTALTRDGAILGTISYMAPEQAAGRNQEIGPSVDVYALGAILYELLTGRPPFQADSWNETIAQVLYDEPAPPTRWQAEVPADLQTVCLKCLEKHPGRRYATARELADELRRFLDGAPVVAVPLSETERLSRLAARDGYEIMEEIGRGPRSTVFRATFGPLNQATAVKVFHPGVWTKAEWEARVQRDAELWAALTHPHLVAVQRAGWWDGIPFVAFEYVAQGSLAAKLTGKPFPTREALRLVEQLTAAVIYVHRQGVAHGNLKPSNVLLAADGIPRISDFDRTGGLFQGDFQWDGAKPAGLGYLTPERLRDPGSEARPHTDIYGLGLIFYELLTGMPAFAESSTRAILEQVTTQDPIAPSRINSEVTPHLEACCMRCLRKNPWRRYRRAFDLLLRLRSLEDHAEDRDRTGSRRP